MRHWIAQEIINILAEVNEERKHYGKDAISVTFLAHESGIAQAGLDNFLKGRTNMHLVNIERVLKVLNYEIDIHEIETTSRLVDCDYNKRRRY